MPQPNSMAYLVIAYPEIGNSDFNLLQDYRKKNDELFYSVVEPHFTLVFPVFNMTENAFRTEIRKKVEGSRGFDFVLRCATINKDAFSDYYHTFLVPDEGYSNTVKLHDKLYGGELKDNLRLDIDFIPHLGVGNSKDKIACKKMVDQWNANDFEIRGTISELTIVSYDGLNIKTLESIVL